MSEKKYSKPFGNLNSMKQTFFKDNDGMLAMADNMADILLSQPERTNCKICGNKLPGVFFTSHKIGYKKCDVCGHLNSECIDNDEFASKVYVEDDYSKNYSAKDKESYRIAYVAATRAKDLLIWCTNKKPKKIKLTNWE